MKEHAFKDKIVGKMENFAEAMIERHIAYDVNVHKNIREIKSGTVLLSDLRILEADEVQALTAFVENGGTLIATRETGTLTKDGHKNADLALAALLGVHRVGENEFDTSYIRRSNPSVKEFIEYDEGYPVAVSGKSTLVCADSGTEVLAYVTLPISSSTDSEVFSSAISDPPINDTAYPAITRKRVGRGQAIYIASALEESRHFEGRRLLSELILSGKKQTVLADAPKWLEVLIYHDEENRRYLVNCLNTMPGYDAEARNVNIYLQTDKIITTAYNVTADAPVSFEETNGAVRITLARVDGFAMAELKY